MRLLKLFVPVLLSIILIVLDTRFSYLDNFKKFTLTLLSPIYVIVDLPSQVINWVNDKGADNEILIGENDYLKSQLIELKARLQTYNNLALENQKISELLDSSYEIPNHDVLLARVKSISQSRLSNKIVIDKGLNDEVALISTYYWLRRGCGSSYASYSYVLNGSSSNRSHPIYAR